MKKILILSAILSMAISATDNFLGVKYNNVSEKNEVYSIDPSTGQSTLLVDFAFPSGYWQPSASFLDSYNGNLYMKDSQGDLVQFNPLDNSVTFIDVVDTDFQSVFQTPWIGKDLIFKNAASETQVGDANNGITISNSSKDTEIKDSNGKTIIKTTAEGETHIGENSLVTVETDGVQLLYATDANGDQIDINIKKGTDLLVDGKSVTQALTDIATNTTGIAANKTNMATNTAGIATNTTNIATNTTGIATNKTNIATNTTRIGNNVVRLDSIVALAASNASRVEGLETLTGLMQNEYRSGIASSIALSQIQYAASGFSIGVGHGEFKNKDEMAVGIGYGGQFNDDVGYQFQFGSSGDSTGFGFTVNF